MIINKCITTNKDNMKKILLFILTILTISCSKDDDSANDNSNFINPPDWIIGTWLDESEPEWAQTGGYQFTNDNLISILSNGEVLLNLKEGLQDSFDTGSITTNEIISDTVYELKLLSSGIVTNQFKF